MSAQKGADYGGIKTMADLKSRCVVDDITGCWVYGMSQKHTPQLWIPALQKRVSAGAAICFLKTGKEIAPGKVWRRMCDCEMCLNPSHRKEMTHGQSTALNNASRTLIARAKSGEVLRRISTKYSDETIRRILDAEGSCVDIGRQHGLDKSYVARLRREGGRRAPGCVGATANSVFSWRPA